jgi:Tfp pilus assembly protein PilX
MLIRRNDEDGIALVTVLLVTMVLMLAVAGSMAYAIGSQPLSRHDQDWNAALAAAEGGIDDYIFRLNENDQYYLYSATNLPPDGNQAFTTWVSVPNSATSAAMRYTVDTTNLTSQGAILLTSTGRSGSVTRSVQATIRRRSFIDYVYFTDYETFDPASYPISGSTYTAVQAQANCARHFFDVPTRGSQCADLNFVTGDTINGALHSNDAILVCGNPVFTGNVTTSYNVAPKYRANSGCSPNNPSFKPGDPKFAAVLTMPPNDVAVKAQTDPTLAGTGCLYTGPTAITLNSSGTMNVTSPFTKSSNCTTGNNVALPPNGVIYVQNVPSATTDANYTAGCLTHTQIVPSGTGAVVQHPLGYPQLGDITTYGCRNGDVFLQGTLKGRLTIAADSNIELIGNITYAGGVGGNDILGLVANNYIEIYHPVGYAVGSTPPAGYCNGGTVNGSGVITNNNNTYCNLDDLVQATPTTSFNNPTIQAALLVVAHSFRVQNYNYGDSSWTGGTLGTITINGAIAQKYRGVVGQTGGSSNSGFLKNYNYDQRLSYQSPPHFLSPVASAWRIATWIEQKAAFAWNAP